jgi:predicted MFS family arabinose efflux permease
MAGAGLPRKRRSAARRGRRQDPGRPIPEILPMPARFLPLLAVAGGLHAADQLLLAALPLAALLLLGAGPETVGLLLAAQGAAWLVLSLPAGLLVDRRPRRGLLLLAGLAGAAGAGLALLGALAGLRAALGAGAFLAASGTVLLVLTAGAAVPAIAGRGGLATANARLELARAVVTLGAPPLAGLLASAGLVALAFALAALAALLAAAAAQLLPPLPAPAAARRRLAEELREGAAFVLREPLLRGIGLCAIAWNCGFFALLAGFVPLALGRLALGPAGLGLAQAGYGAGLLLGAALAPRLIAAAGPGAILLAGPALSLAAPLLLLAAPPGGLALPLAAQYLLGFGPMLWLVCQTGLRQVVTPPALLGRVGAALQVAIYGVRPLGALAGGALAAAAGPEAAILLAALAFALSVAVVPLTGLARRAATC